MAMFNFGRKKKETTDAPCCACSDSHTAAANDCCPEAANGALCCIRVLGSGCKACHALLVNTEEALASMGLSVPVEYVTDMQRIAAYGVMSMPALAVNDRVVSAGRVLKPAEVERLLRELGV